MELNRFFLRYPEFKNVDSELIAINIEDAQLTVSQKVFGKLYEQAICALVAHRLAVKGVLNVDEQTGNASYSNGEGFKSVTNMVAGGLSLGYSSGTLPATTTSDGDLGTTSFGLEYLRLLRLVGIPFMVIR